MLKRFGARVQRAVEQRNHMCWLKMVTSRRHHHHALEGLGVFRVDPQNEIGPWSLV